MVKRYSLLSVALVILLSSLGSIKVAHAVSGSEWQAGRIIDDGIFTDKGSMSVDQIQAFLNQKVGTGFYGNVAGQCDVNGTATSELGGGTRAQYGASHGNPAPFTCLKDYYEVPKTQPGPAIPASNYGGAAIPAGAESAAQLIWDAAQRYNISPKVLLVTIHKESAGPLTTDDWPFKSQYTYAMGAHCPDSGPNGSANCDPNYAGFSIQISESAALLRYYLDNMTQPWWPYKHPGNNTIQYNPNTGCGSSVVNILTMSTAALYTYTPYQPNQAALNNLYGTGDSCSAYGNRNFWRIYNDWFGLTMIPSVFRGTSSNAVYVLIGGKKILISSMALLQDYGYDPNSIQVIAQSTVDATPTPSTADNISSQLGYLVKSPSDTDDDGATVYLVSAGKRYPIPNMDMFNNYGFNTSNITYMPLNYIYSIPAGIALTNYIQTPSQNVFQVASTQKRIIFDYQTYRNMNVSNVANLVSDNLASQIASGAPISNTDILLRSTTGAVNLLTNAQYYSLASYDNYDCWGFNGPSPIAPTYYLVNDSYVATSSNAKQLNCVVGVDATTTYLMSGAVKYAIPTAFGAFGSLVDQNITMLAQKITTSSSPLKQIIKSSSLPAIWFLENSSKKLVPTMADFNLLGLQTTPIDTLKQSAINALSNGGIKLGVGQPIKSTTSDTISIVTASSRLAFASPDDFLAYGNSWQAVESYSSTTIDQNYPAGSPTISKYLYNSTDQKVYLVDKVSCYSIADSLLPNYGQDKSTLVSNQTYSYTLFKNLNLPSCKPASQYVKSSDSDAVYLLSSGQKRPFSSWSSLTTNAQTSQPYIITVSPSTLVTYPTGQPL